jgi:predicted unusual protein kinase regulating ubiquinone biosynthesis (AarF/ABC1/UbiB family)
MAPVIGRDRMVGARDDRPADLGQELLDRPGQLTTGAWRRLGKSARNGLRLARLLGKLSKKLAAADGEPLSAQDMERLRQVVAALGELKGVAMKAGQILSYIDVAMPESMRETLAVLQTCSQPMPRERLRTVVRAELPGRADLLLAGLEPAPLAAASIGQVHRGRLPDGTAVAVKIRYPEVARAIQTDFGPASFASRFVSLLYPNARVDAMIAEARQRFLEECDYLHEARVQGRFGELLAGHAVLRVPRVYPEWSSAGVLVSELVQGQHLEAFLASGPAQETRDRLGRALFEFYLGTLFRHGLYNCDPHPGNYLFQADGRVAMLDYGCTRQFEPPFVAALADLTRAVQADEPALLERAFVRLGLVRDGRRDAFETARGLVRAFYGPMLRDEELAVDLGQAMDLGQVLRGKRKLLRLSLPGEFVFLFRIRFGLMSVLARLGARANWYRLERSFLDG